MHKKVDKSGLSLDTPCLHLAESRPFLISKESCVLLATLTLLLLCPEVDASAGTVAAPFLLSVLSCASELLLARPSAAVAPSKVERLV